MRLATFGSDRIADPPFASHTARGENQREIEGLVSRWAAQYSRGELAKRLEEAGVPSGVVFTVADIFADPLFTERGILLTHEGDDGRRLVMPGIIPELSPTPGDVEWAGGDAGSHNREVYGDLLGLTDDELAGTGEGRGAVSATQKREP